MSPVNDLTVRKATIEDYQAILDITGGEYLWEGLDYIPFALKKWLQEAQEECSNRQNIVFLLDNKIVGYESFYFQNGGKVAARFGFRTKQELRGKGYGRQMLELQLDYLRINHKITTLTLSAIPDIDLPDQAFQSGKLGEKLTKKGTICLNVNLKTYKFPTLADNCTLRSLDKKAFASILQNGTFKKISGGNLILLNWVPILLNTQDDIRFAVRKECEVIVGGDDEDPESLSALTLPIPCPAGLRCSIDVYAPTDKSCSEHVIQQIRNCFLVPSRVENFEGDFLRVEIHVESSQISVVREVLKDLGLEKCQWIKGKMRRDHDSVYVFQQNI